MSDEILDHLRLELRRGSLSLAVLAELREEQCGYTLRKILATSGLDIEESALYPMLRRLETQGLLNSQWREEDRRNKRFYKLSAEGKKLLSELIKEWRELNTALERVVTQERGHGTAESLSKRRRNSAA